VAYDPLNQSSTAQDSVTEGTVMVTLAVTQSEAEKLILLEELGLPYMAMLGPNANMISTAPAARMQMFGP